MTLAVYRATSGFPREETYGLTRQLRRSCASIPANLAEGCGRETDNELAYFSRIAAGSAREVEYHLLLARDLAFLGAEDHQSLSSKIDEIQRMLTVLLRRLKAHSS